MLFRSNPFSRNFPGIPEGYGERILRSILFLFSMGQYHTLVNFDKKEVVSPHNIGLGLKQCEHTHTVASLSDVLYMLTCTSPARGGGDLEVSDKLESKFKTFGRWVGDRVTFSIMTRKKPPKWQRSLFPCPECGKKALTHIVKDKDGIEKMIREECRSCGWIKEFPREWQ